MNRGSSFLTLFICSCFMDVLTEQYDMYEIGFNRKYLLSFGNDICHNVWMKYFSHLASKVGGKLVFELWTTRAEIQKWVNVLFCLKRTTTKKKSIIKKCSREWIDTVLTSDLWHVIFSELLAPTNQPNRLNLVWINCKLIASQYYLSNTSLSLSLSLLPSFVFI